MTPYYEHAGITIYHGDCREILPHVTPSASKSMSATARSPRSG